MDVTLPVHTRSAYTGRYARAHMRVGQKGKVVKW